MESWCHYVYYMWVTVFLSLYTDLFLAYSMEWNILWMFNSHASHKLSLHCILLLLPLSFPNQQFHRGCRIYCPPLSLHELENNIVCWFQLSIKHNLTHKAKRKTSHPGIEYYTPQLVIGLSQKQTTDSTDWQCSVSMKPRVVFSAPLLITTREDSNQVSFPNIVKIGK